MNIKQITVKNIQYNVVGKAVAFLFQTAANIILSRELVAEDYGIAGFAMICVSFMRTFSGLGLNRAVVQFNDFDEIAKNTAFTLRQLLGFAAFLLTYALSGLAGYFVDHSAITSVIKVLAVAILIDNLSFISSVYLERSLKYSVIAFAEAGLTIVSSITAICLAMLGFKYWSIVYAFLAANAVFVVITYWYMPYKARFEMDFAIAKQYLKFGSTVFLTGVISFAIYNMDNTIIGSVAGVAELGYYSIAFNWGSMISSILSALVLGMLFSTFSRMQGDAVMMKTTYLKVVQYTALFSLLCNVGLICVADDFLVYVLGKSTDKWIPSLLSLRILSVYGIFRTLIEPASSLLMAQGNTRTPLKASITVATIELLLVYPAIRFGSIEVVSAVILIACIAQIVIYLPALRRSNDLLFADIARLVRPALAAAAIMIGCSFFIKLYMSAGFGRLVVSVIALAIVYLVSYDLFTRRKVYHEIKATLLKQE